MSLTISMINLVKSSKKHTSSPTPTLSVIPDKEEVIKFLNKWVVIFVVLIILDIILLIFSFFAIFHSNFNNYVICILLILLFIPHIGPFVQICIILYYIIYIKSKSSSNKS